MMRHLCKTIVCFFVLIVCASLAVNVRAQESKLGKVEFQTTGSPEAQAHFLRGLAALHSFWYEEALREFKEATKVDPSFMMGYWGEAMTYNHPLWGQQDTEAGRQSLAMIKSVNGLSARETAFINALKLLYGEGDKLARDTAYSAAMEQVYKAYPADLEAACFYALSLLGTVRPGDKGFRRQMLAGKIALDVFAKNPNHPGAAHYIIHAFDDPEHAILALEAAKLYSRIAPDAHHAQHMPAHIFLQLGMWPEAAASNEAAWATSDAWVKRRNLSLSLRDYHSLHWLLYVYLQQGRYGEAESLLATIKQAIEADGGESKNWRHYQSDMAAAFVVETEKWSMTTTLFGSTAQAGEMSSMASMSMHSGANAYSLRGQTLSYFVLGMSPLANAAQVERSLSGLRDIQGRLEEMKEPYQAKQVSIMKLEVEAGSKAAAGKFEEALGLMNRATALEEELSPPSGPPELIKPSHELLGELLLKAGKPQEAAAAFAVSLLRQPNRARSILGAARAAAQLGRKQEAMAAYTNLLQLWERADASLPERKEALKYTQTLAAKSRP
jgi:tetratricopeptide (TPR) repeat protein